MQLKPAANLVAGGIAGTVVAVGAHYAKVTYNLQLTPDIADGLTYSVAVIVAHVWDVLTGQNVPPPTQGQAPPPPIMPPSEK